MLQLALNAKKIDSQELSLVITQQESTSSGVPNAGESSSIVNPSNESSSSSDSKNSSEENSSSNESSSSDSDDSVKDKDYVPSPDEVFNTEMNAPILVSHQKSKK